MIETKVPGITAKHAVITDESRAIHGDGAAFHKAAFALLSEYNDVVRQRGNEKGINYHLVLTMEDTKGCVCRSYYERTGEHAEVCPLAVESDGPDTSQYPLLDSPIRPPLPERQEGSFNTVHVREQAARAKRPTEVLPAVKDPAPHLTQAEKDAGFDGA